jgi:hypothetical protein
MALFSNFPNPEGCDATDDDSSTTAGKKIQHLLKEL